jgi:hypothetical protein
LGTPLTADGTRFFFPHDSHRTISEATSFILARRGPGRCSSMGVRGKIWYQERDLNSRPAHPAPSTLSGPVKFDGTLGSAKEVHMSSCPKESASVCDRVVTINRSMGLPIN